MLSIWAAIRFVRIHVDGISDALTVRTSGKVSFDVGDRIFVTPEKGKPSSF